MSTYVTIEASSTFLISDYAHKKDGQQYRGRLLNAPAIEGATKESTQTGQKIRELSLQLDNKDGLIDIVSEDVRESVATVKIDGYAETWTGRIDSVDLDIKNGTLTVKVVEDTSAILQCLWPRFMLITSNYDNLDGSVTNKVVPIVAGGTASNPIRVPGLLADVVDFIYLFAAGKCRQVPKVESNGSEITTGFTIYLGTADQAYYPGFLCIKFDADPRDNADAWPEIVIEMVGLEFDGLTAEQCRNPIRVYKHLLTTVYGGVGGIGMGVSSGDLDSTAFTQAITDCDTIGFKLDGIFNEQKDFGIWRDIILAGCRGSAPFTNGKWSALIDKDGASVKTFHGNNSNVSSIARGSVKEQINVVTCKYRYRYNQAGGSFIHSCQRPDPFVGDNPKQKQIELPLVADHFTAGAIADYEYALASLQNLAVTIDTLGKPAGAEVPGAILTGNYPSLGLNNQLLKTMRPVISDNQIVLETKAYSASIFDITSGSTPANPVISKVLHGTNHILPPDAITALALTTGHEVRQDGTIDVWINGSFTKSRNFTSADLQVSDDGALTWMTRASTLNDEFHLSPLDSGHEYYVRVIAHGINGQASPVTASPITTDGPAGPADVTGFAVARDALDYKKVKFSWNAVVSSRLKEYEIRKGSSWATAEVIGWQISGTKFEFEESTNGTYTYLIKAFDKSGTPSANAGSVTIELKIYPSDVANPKAFQNGEFILLTWDVTNDLDILGVEIHEGPSFDLGDKIADAITDNSHSIKAGSEKQYNFWFKFKTTRKAYSQNAAWVGLTVTNLMPKNYIITQNEITNPTGVHFQTAIGSSAFRMKDLPGRATDPMYRSLRWNMMPGGAVLKLAQSSPGVYFETGYYEILIDIVQATTVGIDIDSFLFTLPPGVSATITYSYAVDALAYSNWEPFAATTKVLRYLKIRVNLATSDTAKTPEITRLTIKLDVPDIDRRIRVDVQDTVDGTYISFGYTYNLKPYVVLTAEGAYLGELTSYVTEDPLNLTQKFIGVKVRAQIPNTNTYVTAVAVNGHIKGY